MERRKEIKFKGALYLDGEPTNIGEDMYFPWDIVKTVEKLQKTVEKLQKTVEKLRQEIADD